MIKMKKIFRIQPKRLWTLIALSSVIVFAAACSQTAAPSANSSSAMESTLTSLSTEISQSATTTGPKPVTAGNCTLLSKEDVGKILAEEVLEAREPSPDGSICAYQTQNLILELTFLHKFGGFVDSVGYMQNIRTNDDTVADVPGLGDEAFYHGQPAYRLLLVRKGDTVYGFGVRNASDQSLSSPENAQALEKSVADLLLSRLP